MVEVELVVLVVLVLQEIFQDLVEVVTEVQG